MSDTTAVMAMAEALEAVYGEVCTLQQRVDKQREELDAMQRELINLRSEVKLQEDLRQMDKRYWENRFNPMHGLLYVIAGRVVPYYLNFEDEVIRVVGHASVMAPERLTKPPCSES